MDFTDEIDSEGGRLSTMSDEEEELSQDKTQLSSIANTTQEKCEPEEYIDYSTDDEFEGGEILPDHYQLEHDAIKNTEGESIFITETSESNCANCRLILQGENLRDGKNFHQVLPLDLINIDTGEPIQVELIAALSEIFKLQWTCDEYKEMYGRNDLFLCAQCTSILIDMYKLFHQFMSLAVQSSAFLSSVIKLQNSTDEIPLADEVEDYSNLSPPDIALEKPCLKRLRSSAKKVYAKESNQKTTNSLHLADSDDQKILEIPSKKSKRPQAKANNGKKLEDKTNYSSNKIYQKKTNSLSSPKLNVGECDRCSKQFKTEGGLKIHYASHVRDDNKHVCHCGKKFRKQEALEFHEKRDHGGFKPYNCPNANCDKSFRLKDKLKLHIMVIHDKKKPFPCSKCEKSFRTKYHLKIHDVAQHIQGGDSKIGCSQCRRSFSDMKALERHVSIHDEEKSHKCATCSKGFQTAGRLKLHEKSHQEVQCLCPICGRSYKHLRDLRLHEVIHQDESTYRFGCGDCSRKFYRIDLLRVHQSNEQHFSPEIVGPTITKIQQPYPPTPYVHANISFSSAPVAIKDDYEDEEEDENETDTEIEVAPEPSKQAKQIPLSTRNKKPSLNSLAQDNKIQVVHPHATVIYPSNVIQLQFNQQNVVSRSPVKGNSATILPTTSSLQPTTSYFITQRDRSSNLVHHHPIQIQPPTSGSHQHIQYGNQTIYATNPINITNATGGTEQIGFDLIHSLMNNLG